MPLCPCDGRQAGLWYLPARWRDTTEALKDELIYGQRLAVDEDGRVLVWTGDTGSVAALAAAPKYLSKSNLIF